MKEKNDCKIVQDLLPKDLKIKEEKRDNREVKYMKKYNKELKVMKNFLLFILVALIIVIVAFFINTFRKFVILSDLQKKAEQYSSAESYHIKQKTTFLDRMDKLELTEDIYSKNNKMLNVRKSETDYQINKTSSYTSEGRIVIFNEEEREGETEKTVEIRSDEEVMKDNQFVGFPYEEETAWQTFLLSMKLKVDRTTLPNDGEYYLISHIVSPKDYHLEYLKFYIDANTGLKYRAFASNLSIRYEYEFNNVNEEVFIQPNIEEYQVKEM